MADDDDWRYRKALQLGLAQAPPPKRDSAPRPTTRPPLPTFRAAAYAQPAVGGAPTRGSGATPQRGPGGRLALIAAAAALVVLAVAAGWLLHARFGPGTAPIDIAAPVVPAPAAQAPAVPVAAPLDARPERLPPEPVATMRPDTSDDVLPAAIPAVLPPAPTAAPVPVATPKARVAAPAASRPLARTVRASRPVPQQAVRRSRVTRATTAVRASFDCRRARSRDQQLICGSPYLAALDRDVAQVYRQVVRQGGTGDPFGMDRDQAAFLNRRAACDTERCLGQLYNRRRAELGGN